MMTISSNEKLNYIYKINEHGEVSNVFDLTLFKFNVLTKHRRNRTFRRRFNKQKLLILSKKKNNILTNLLVNNNLEIITLSKLYTLFYKNKLNIIYNNHYINNILYLNNNNENTFLLLNNIFFNF